MYIKRLYSLEHLENEGLKVLETDIPMVEALLLQKIELSYDETLKVYDESGRYIAHLLNCK